MKIIKGKPASMSEREWFIKKLATSLMISEKEIRQVIAHQFDSANDATKKYKSIEISGFGTFLYNQKKADELMKDYEFHLEKCNSHIENPETSENDRIRWKESKEKYLGLIELINIREENGKG